MNPELTCIFQRRSVRAYTDEPVTDALVTDLLEAAMAAPSACAKDPWEFVVVRDRKRLRTIAEGLPNGRMLASAAVGIVVCGDVDRANANELSYMLQDCSAAIENILLAAPLLGLGAVWLGVHPRPDRVALVRDLFSLPPNIVPVSAIAMGWPAQDPPPRTRYDAARVHAETWP